MTALAHHGHTLRNWQPPGSRIKSAHSTIYTIKDAPAQQLIPTFATNISYNSTFAHAMFGLLKMRKALQANNFRRTAHSTK